MAILVTSWSWRSPKLVFWLIIIWVFIYWMVPLQGTVFRWFTCVVLWCQSSQVKTIIIHILQMIKLRLEKLANLLKLWDFNNSHQTLWCGFFFGYKGLLTLNVSNSVCKNITIKKILVSDFINLLKTIVPN